MIKSSKTLQGNEKKTRYENSGKTKSMKCIMNYDPQSSFSQKRDTWEKVIIRKI